MSVEAKGESAPSEINWRLLPILIAILALIPLPLLAQSAAPDSSALLQFLNGAMLHGSLKSLDTNLGLNWQHPDAASPFTLQPGQVDFIRFARAQSMSVSPTCQFHFADGDDLFGSLVSLDTETLEFNTWFGATMKIPRAAIQTMRFLPTNYSLLYEGPGEASEWVVGNGQGRTIVQNGMAGNFVILGGGIVNIGGVNYTGAQNPTPPWTYQDGGYVSAGPGTLGREFHLARSSTIEFDLACATAFNLLVNLYSPSVDKLELDNNSISLSLDNNPAFRRARSTWTPKDLGSVTLAEFDKRGVTRITLHCNKENGSISLLQDGVLLQRWTDLGGFDGMGGGIIFQNQFMGSALKLSNFKISQWDGAGEPDVADVTITNTDTVSFLNHDQAGGKIESISGGMLGFHLAGRLLRIPATRVKSISFAPSSTAAEPRGAWEVRALFPGGGRVSFALEKWDSQTVSGRSALFGSVTFPTASIRQLQFNLDHPKEEAALFPENKYDVLDQ